MKASGNASVTQEKLRRIEDAVSTAALALLALLPAANAVFRFAFKGGMIPSGPELISHLLLVLGMLSGMICTRTGEHLSIGLFQFIKDEKVKLNLSCATNWFAAFLTTIFFWCSISFIRVGLNPPQMVGPLPDAVFALAMPLGYAVITWRLAFSSQFHLTEDTEKRRARGKIFLGIAAVAAGTVCSLPAIFKIAWGIDLPEAAWTATDLFCQAAALLKVPLLVVLALAALAGTPLFAVIGGFALLLLQSSFGEIDIVANQIYSGLTNSSLVAIPLFTLAGFFLSESRAGERLVEAFKGLFGWLPGGMIFVTVILCAFFTSFTGASGVTILALGGILYTVLAGYPDKFIVGLLTASGSIGLLFPPSLPILLVGASTRTNTVHLFLGGFLPGVLLVAAMIGFGIVISVKTKIPLEKFSIRRAARGIKHSFFELLLPLLLIAGYFTGILSLTEVSAAAVLYVFVVEVAINREIKLKDVGAVFRKAIPIAGGILSILALAQALSYYIVDSQAPEIFARWMQNAVHSKWLFLLLLNVALLITGCLIDIFSAIMIILPLLTPLCAVYGIAPVHLGIIFLINMEAGFLTPPVGLNLFLASYRFKKPFVEIARNVFPFLLIQLVVVLAVTYIPALSMWLTGLY
jgi:tripartite ATP-independent transporter DctM subunit